jgi:hypothetical protein
MRYMKITAIGLMLLVNVAQAAPVLNPAGISRIIREGDDDPMRSKTFSKTFAADNTDKIVLGNVYGSIVIKIWDRKEVKADIDIKAYSNDEAGAQKLLDGVTIEAGKSGDQIVFKTKLEEQGNWGSGKRLGRKWRREVKVDYVVYMPASNALTMSQNYGNIAMGDLTGPLYAKVQYGNFAAQNLSNSNNYISVQYGNTNIQNVNKAVVKHQYGSGLTIGTAGTLDINAQYAAVNVSTIKGDAVIKQQYGSGLTIGTVHDLDLNAQYCNVNLSSIKGDAKIDQQYNNLTIGSVGKLELKTQYTSTSVETLRGDGRFNMQYNKLSINEVTNGCKALFIDGDYLNISAAFESDYSADLEVQTSYASFKYGDRVSANQVGNKEDSNSKHYMGKIGKGGGAVVKIKSDYGSVTIK